MKSHIVISALFFFFSLKAFTQKCEIFSVPGIPVYFYPVQGQVSYSRLNDSTNYSFRKVNSEYHVKKLVKDSMVESTIYFYKGKKKKQVFKVKTRRGDKMYLKNERKMICILSLG
jgi:hypothetical protein